MGIPFANLERQIDRLKPELHAAFEKVLASRAFIQGHFAEAFEQEWLATHGGAHAISCANGTAALSLALEALGVGPGHEVLLPAHTFAATAEAVRHVGAVPVFVDIEPQSYNIDVEAAAAAITPRTRAIVPVHIYGSPCDLARLRVLCRERGLFLIEDCAQAHLARSDGVSVGTDCDAATFSFYPGKNLGAFGDAGLILARSQDVADRLRRLRDHGRTGKYEHGEVGYNQRMDGLQAALLSVKLPQLAGWTARRRAVAARYDTALHAKGFKLIAPRPADEAVYHLYVVEVSNRDAVAKHMAKSGIATGIHYPVPLHQQPAFAPWTPPAGLPVTERICHRILSLPICAEITDDEQDAVIRAFLDVAVP